MPNITIGRYDEDLDSYSGWIEGQDAKGESWIIYLESGRPTVYWPKRDQSGAVAGEPIRLS